MLVAQLKEKPMSKKNVAAAVNNSAAIASLTQSAKITASTMQRISNLAVRREAWENTEYNRSNQALYSVIAECLDLYLDLTSGTEIKSKKDGLALYINSKGYSFKESSPLSLKVIRCVFGDRDRRRLSTYHTVLRVAIDDKWAVSDVAKNISDCGGVQEISMRKPGGLSAKDKANAARAALMNQSIATLSSDAIKKQFNTEHVAENAVAVMTLNSDGTYSVHCVVRSATAVNAALAGYFSANKEVLVGLQEQQKAQAAEADKAQVIASAAAAANDAQAELTA
jgi:hypothetical protein